MSGRKKLMDARIRVLDAVVLSNAARGRAEFLDGWRTAARNDTDDSFRQSMDRWRAAADVYTAVERALSHYARVLRAEAKREQRK